jgi:hypothetical protein
MKKFIKYLPLVIALCAIADTQFELLVSIGLKENLVNYIKLLGLILTAFLPSLIEVKNEMQIKSDQVGKRPKKKGELDSDDDSMA